MSGRPVYFDHNATALPHRPAAEAAAAWLLGPGGNPSSVHSAGRRARAAVEAARRHLATALGVRPGELIFTSGATEAIYLAIAGLASQGARALVSAVEHPAVFGACESAGMGIDVIPVDGAGRIDVSGLAARVRPETALVAVMAAQNELGNVYPTELVSRAVAPVPLLVDAVQRFGRLPLTLGAAGESLACVSAHKIGGPTGVGALWVRPGLGLRSVVCGGPQERGRRAGTENVAGIVGFGSAAAAVPERLVAMERVNRLRDHCEDALLRVEPGVVFHGVERGAEGERLPNTLSFRFRGVPGDLLLAALDLAGFCLSSGSACASGALTASPVLLALGIDAESARGAVRLSLGPETTQGEVDDFLSTLPGILEQIRSAIGGQSALGLGRDV